METGNSALMRNARSSLSGKWGLAIGTFVVYFLIITVFRYIPFMGEALAIFISGPLMLGLAKFSLSLSRNEPADISQLFQGFDTFAAALITYLLVMVFVILWTLLLIIPGIIAGLSSAMTFFILADGRNRSKQNDDGWVQIEIIRSMPSIIRTGIALYSDVGNRIPMAHPLLICLSREVLRRH